MLPEQNGFEILGALRQRSAVPVILLTTRGEDVDRIVGLEIGAHDYLPKPFNSRELTARIHAVLRRNQPRDRDNLPSVTVGDVTLDPATRTVMKNDAAVELTTVEFDLLPRAARNGRTCGHARRPQPASTFEFEDRDGRRIGLPFRGRRGGPAAVIAETCTW